MSANGHRNGKVREELLRQSDDMRSKLVRTVARIDHRRHDVLDVGKQVQRHLKQIVLAIGLVVVASAGATAFVVYRVMAAAQRRRAPWRLGAGLRNRPERERRTERRSFAGEVLRSLALTLATSLLGAPFRRASRASD